jgi:Tar ligand binding domain homologue
MSHHVRSSKLNSIPVRTLLILSSVVLTVIILAVGSAGIWGMYQIQRNLNQATTDLNVKASIINKISIGYLTAASNMGSAASANSDDIAKPYLLQFADAVKTFESDVETYLAMPHLPEEIDLFQNPSSRLQLPIVDTSNQVEPESKPFSSVAVFVRDDPESF